MQCLFCDEQVGTRERYETDSQIHLILLGNGRATEIPAALAIETHGIKLVGWGIRDLCDLFYLTIIPSYCDAFILHISSELIR